MKSKRLTPRRYQLNKTSLITLQKKHPWIFRSHLSTAITAYPNGQWLELVDGNNQTKGVGIYEQEGVTGIRILSFTAEPVTPATLKKSIEKAIEKRQNLKNYTEGYRVLHGENDHFPAVTLDVFGKVGVLQTYVPSVDTLGRFAAAFLRDKLKLESVLWKPPVKRKKETSQGLRALYGKKSSLCHFQEGPLKISLNPLEGQKSGFFLDLRNLRKWITQAPLKNKRVLNLFSYTGTLGLAAEHAGAREIWNVDISNESLQFAKKHHSRDPRKFKNVTADIFKWLLELNEKEKFDLIILDPPQLVSQKTQMRNALQIFSKLIKKAKDHVAPGGFIAVGCCTSRITRDDFEKLCHPIILSGFKKIKDLKAEDDHPITFPEGDYLKIFIFQKR